MSDAVHLHRPAPEQTLQWVADHAKSMDLPGLIAAIEAHKTPVYLVKSPLLQALLRWLLLCPIGFVPLPEQRARSRSAASLLASCYPKDKLDPWKGFFWMPAKLASEGFLLHQIHHWLMSRQGETPEASISIQAQLQQIQAAADPMAHIDQLDEADILELRSALYQELDALLTVQAYMLNQAPPPTA